MAKGANNAVQTGVVTLKHLHLTKPDDHFNPENPDFNVTFVMPKEEGKALIQEIETKMPQFKGKVQSNRDDEDNYIFKVKQRKFIEWRDRDSGELKRVEFKPTILNKDNSVYDGAEPWGGSTGEVAFLLRESKKNGKPHLAMSLKGVRLHDVTIGTEGGNDFDPLFGNNTSDAAPKQAATEVTFDDLENEDDIPFN